MWQIEYHMYCSAGGKQDNGKKRTKTKEKKCVKKQCKWVDCTKKNCRCRVSLGDPIGHLSIGVADKS